MGILNPKATTPSKVQPTQPHAVAPTIHSAIVDTRYNPLATLLTHIEGASWIVDYYSQVLDSDDASSDLQPTLDAVYQQYRLIKKLELRVNSELTQSQNETTRAFDIGGSASMYPGVIPNDGDVFVADIGDGQLGVFTITKSEKKAIFKDACYQITYVMRSYMDAEAQRDLDGKVVLTSTFIKDQLNFGKSPVVINSELDQINRLRKGYSNLIAHYFGDFYNVEYNTLLLPDQQNATYDPFLTSNVLNTIDQKLNLALLKIKVLNVDRDTEFKRPSIWTCLLTMSDDLLPMCFHKAGVVGVIHFADRAEMNGVFYSGIENVIYPTDKTTLSVVDHACEPYIDPFVSGRVVPGAMRSLEVERLIHTTQLGAIPSTAVLGEDALPDIHLVTKDDYYVFSEAFYKDLPLTKSKLEKLTLETLRGEPVNKATLVGLIESAKFWGNLERFYYIPILLIVIQMALRDY